MGNYALFINGVYREVLKDICAVQEYLPDQILFLQPYSGQSINKLAENVPTADDPVQMFISLTDDLGKVHYCCEIVGWDDKTKMIPAKREVIDRIIREFLKTEDGVYAQGGRGGPECRNLLHVRRMLKLARPFGVENLIKISNHSPYSPHRSTAGGWSYVENPDQDFLFERIHGYSKEVE